MQSVQRQDDALQVPCLLSGAAEKMRMLVIGAGSTGGYFGGRLAQAGRDVTFLVRPARAEQLRDRGLQIISPHGDTTLQPQLVTSGRIVAPFDIVLLTVKAYSLNAALADLAPAVGPETMILPVLNGMQHVEVLSARFGQKTVVGCACKVAAIVDDQGRVVQLSALQDIAYGEMNGTLTERIKQLDAFLQGAGFDTHLSTTIARDMWEKWILLSALGGITCLMRGTVGEIEATQGGGGIALRLLDEIVSIARAVGESPSEEFLSSAKVALTEAGSALTSSMYRDLQRGAPIEADQIVGDLLARGKKGQLSTPLLAAAYTHLSVYQNRRSALTQRPQLG
jgi:2-dehydropantoate 2-reductase